MSCSCPWQLSVPCPGDYNMHSEIIINISKLVFQGDIP